MGDIISYLRVCYAPAVVPDALHTSFLVFFTVELWYEYTMPIIYTEK